MKKSNLAYLSGNLIENQGLSRHALFGGAGGALIMSRPPRAQWSLPHVVPDEEPQRRPSADGHVCATLLSLGVQAFEALS